MLGLDILLCLLIIAVSTLYYQRVLGNKTPYLRMLAVLAPVMAAFQAAYRIWPACYLFSSAAAPLLSSAVAVVEAAVTIVALRLLSKARWAQVFLFYSLALLIQVASSLLLFALSALFSGAGIATLAATQWNDFFSSFISAVLQMGLLFAVAEGVAQYAKKQTAELRFSQFAPVLGAEAASVVILVVLMRESGLYERMLPALAVLLLLYAIADAVLLSAFRAFVKNSELEHEIQAFEQMQSAQKTYYRSLDQQFQQARRMRHDYRNVLQTVEALIEKGEAEKARGFAAECSAQLDSSGGAFYTGNNILDAVLFSKSVQAKDAGVHFTVELTLPEPLGMADADVMAVFANLLDNALEYTAGLPANAERLVSIHGAVRAGLWILSFSNTYEGDTPPSFHTTKTDSALHGYGTGIVRSIVEKYGGTLSATVENRKLVITLTMNTSLKKCDG